jgi:arylsulfatase A-like enzyme/tetratricopeptide (TPR) repeat protein
LSAARSTRALGLPLALVLAISVACRRAPPAEPPRARHLVLVTIDTLRADRLGLYGNREVATPRLDRIGREGAWAVEATTHVPLTRPAHVSLFTGLLPSQNGIRDNISPAVVARTPLLAEELKRAGFETAAFVSSVVLEASSGLNRGFDTYAASFEGSGGSAQFLSSLQRKGNLTTADAIQWLEEKVKAKSPRLFLWLHLYDPHDPYEPPEPYATRYASRPYDGEVAYTDELVGRLDDALARLGLREATLLVATSDHGEGLGEHGETLHGFFTYQTTLRVPFLARGPGVKPGTELTSTVRLVDVFPTVLDMFGLPAPAGGPLAGRSLARALGGFEKPEEPVTYAESLVPLLHFGWSDLRVLREGRWKYIQAPKPELYDLATDPGERTNLFAAQGPRAQAMRGALGRFLDDERQAGAQGTSASSVPPELLEKLGALGYVGGAAPAETATPGADPKDKVEDFRFANDSIRNGLLALKEKDYQASVARFQGVLKRGISSFEVHFYLGQALRGLRLYRDATPHLEDAVRLLPSNAAAWEELAENRISLREPESALGALRKGAAALPAEPRLKLFEARLLLTMGRKTEARQAYEIALPLAPKSARARAALGDLLRELGELDEAIRRQREAVELEPQNASYWNSLGMTLGGQGQMAEAERAFREALKLDDRDHRHAFNLGLALVRQGRGAEARPYFEKALALKPTFTPARDELLALRRARP